MDTSLPVLGLAAIVPVFLYLWLLTAFDRQPQAAQVILGTFVFGALGAALSGGIVPSSEFLYFPEDVPVLDVLFQTIRQIAVPEETVKFFVLLMYSQRYLTSRNPLQAVVYGASAGLGFAAAENLAYILHHQDRWQEVAVVRALVTMPLHGGLGVIAGIYVARAHFAGTFGMGDRLNGDSGANYLKGWLTPIVLHAFYDFPFILVGAAVGLEDWQRTLFNAFGLIVGIAVILAGAWLTYRVACEQSPDTEAPSLSSLFHLTAWRLQIFGGMLGLAGILIVLTAIPATLSAAEGGSPLEPAMLLGGALLVALSAAIYGVAQRSRRPPTS